jgi:HlyD family secretion protein
MKAIHHQKNMTLAMIGAILLGFSSCGNQEEKSDAYGNFELDKTIISAEAQGRILFLNVDEGQQLKAGDILGQIDTVAFYYQKIQLFAQQELATASLPDIDAQYAVQKQQETNILVNKERTERLFQKKAATQKQVDDIEASLSLTHAQMKAITVKKNQVFEQVKSIQAQIDNIDYQITKCVIVSPVDGKVLNKLSRTGEMAAPGKPLFTMAALDDIRLKIYVSGNQLPHVKIGQPVDVLIDNDTETNTTLSGEVVWISEQAEFTPKTVQTKEERVNLVYAVKVKCPNDGSLKAGMPAEVNFK